MEKLDLILEVLVDTLHETCQAQNVSLEGFSLTICQHKFRPKEFEIFLMLQSQGGQRKSYGRRMRDFFSELVKQCRR